MGIRDVIRGLSEDIETLKRYKKSGRLKRELEISKERGTYKQRAILYALSKATNHKSKKRKHRKTKRKSKRRY